MDTLEKELKAVFLKKNDSENRVKSRLLDYKKILRFFFHDFNAWSGLIVLETKFPPTVETFWLLIFLEWIKPVVLELHEFEWKKFTIMGVFLAFSDYHDFNTKEEFKNDQI